MNGLIPAPKGRIRTPVGQKYLEALQSKFNGISGITNPPSLDARGPGLDLLVLGITSGTTIHDIDLALCQFTQESPEAPLHLEIVKVFPEFTLFSRSSLTSIGMIPSQCHQRSAPTF